MEIKDIVLPLLGGAIALSGALILRSIEEWRTFRREISIIRNRFETIREPGIEPVHSEYAKSVDIVTSAVLRVRPYVWKNRADRLSDLLRKYQSADQCRESGLASGAPGLEMRTELLLPDPKTARDYLCGLLEAMEQADYI